MCREASVAVANFVLWKLLLSGRGIGIWHLPLFFFYMYSIFKSQKLKLLHEQFFQRIKEKTKSCCEVFPHSWNMIWYQLLHEAPRQYTVNLDWESMTQGSFSVFIAISGFHIFSVTVSKRGKKVCCNCALGNGLEPHSYLTCIKMRKVNLI